jgi:hypothetical protein
MYGVETATWSDQPRVLYRAVDPHGLLWHEVPHVHLAHSYSGFHRGVRLIPAPDGRKLFVRRPPLWSDCIDVAAEPIRSCGRVRYCCISGDNRDDTDQEGVMRDSERVEASARAAGIVGLGLSTAEH